METNSTTDKNIIDIALLKGKLEAVKICKLMYGINLKEAKEHVDDITKGLNLPNQKIDKKGCVIIFVFIAFIGLIVALFTGNQDPSTPTKETKSKVYSKIGEVLKTEFFDVTVNKIFLTDFINFHNEFMDVKAGEGNKFLILNVTVKNTDKETRTMFSDGILWINYNGQEYKYETSETILNEGWGFILDAINPLVSKTTRIVYKMPKEVTGEAYFQSSRSNNDERIYLGEIGLLK